jgi:peptidoglycan/LPS O-acetylase OafA/YrhL
MDQAGPAPGTPESRALTGLRGIAALLVLMHHFFLHFGGDLGIPLLSGVLRRGYLGVDLFFVLSGFVISMVYGRWFGAAVPGRTLAARIGTFLLRRVARIWPLHVVVVLVLIGLAAAGQHGFSVRFSLVNLALVQGWGISGEINPPAWSISAELLAYLLFPLLAPAVLRNRLGVLLGLVIVVSALAICLGLAPPAGPERRGLLDIHYNYSVLPVLRCLAGFVLGMLAWRAGAAPAVRRFAQAPWTGPGALLLLLGLMLAHVNDLLMLALLPVIVLGMHLGRGWAWRLLTVQPLHGLGVLSYAIYLIHYALLTTLPVNVAPWPLMLALYLPATLLLAGLAHFAIEAPTRQVMRWAGDAALGLTGRRAARA